MTTIGALSRPRSGERLLGALAELALPALTVVSGLQLLRLMVATLLGVYRDRLGAPLTHLALFAFGVVALGLLAGPAARLLGARQALVASAAGVALVRLVVQLVPDALARWLLAPLGVVLFLWFVPLWLARGSGGLMPGPPEGRGRDGRGLGLALLVGLAADAALAGLGGSWDYAWSLTPWTVALAVLLAGAALGALAALPGPGPDPPGWRWADVAPLAGIGPALFLHALVWQNLGWQAELGDRSPAQAFLLVMVGNLAALAAGTAAALAREVRWPVAATALAGLAVAVAVGEAAPAAAGVLGQAATAVLLVAIVRRATEPPGGAPPGSGAGLGAPVAAWTAGMGLFVLLVLAYYAVYDMVLPVDNGLFLALAAALVGLAGTGAARAGAAGAGSGRAGSGRAGPAPTGTGSSRPGPGRAAPNPIGGRAAPNSIWGRASPNATGGGAPSGGVADRNKGGAALSTALVGVGVALLLAPLVFWATAPDPVAAAPGPGAGRPVRMMSYNLHFGFDVRGWSDLEGLARAIEATGAEVVGLQEVSRGWYVNGATDMLGWLQRRLRMPHARFAGASDGIWGNAVLSRHPIVADEVVRLPREGVPLRRSALRVEVDLGGGERLGVVVTHLHHVEGPGGARVRLAQLPAVLGLAGRPATVLMGDLNAEPGSAEIARVRSADLADAFVAGGGGPADELTWPSDRPDRRIDYIWLSPDLAASGFVATTSTASDHRGIAVTVRPGG